MRSAIKIAVDSLKENTANAEIAFFGGSFTAIDREYMIALLDAAYPYTDRFKGIRISTRPDCIDEEVLSLLKNYRVTSIELGAQSMSDEVLLSNERGHTADDVRIASRLIRDYSFELGLQMMTGLYRSDDMLDMMTAEEFIQLDPSTVRIYPTVVMKNTRLALLYERGAYAPQTLDQAIDLCASLIERFTDCGIRVIRVGLHDSETLRRDMITGPFHPAFRELCESRMMYKILLEKLQQSGKHRAFVAVSPRFVSKAIGHKQENLRKLRSLSYDITIVPDPSLDDFQVTVKDEG